MLVKNLFKVLKPKLDSMAQLWPQMQTTESMIISSQLVATMSASIILFILFWIVVEFRQSLNKLLHRLCIISIASFAVFSVLQLGIVNVIFPISCTRCKIFYPLGLFVRRVRPNDCLSLTKQLL